MGRNVYFNSPFLLGFDHLERLLERTAKAAADGYPPYNIEELPDDRLRITLAVAGFSRDELAITVEENQLAIRGKQIDTNKDLAVSRHCRAAIPAAFVLAEGIKVDGAALENRSLIVELTRQRLEPEIRTIEIRGGNATSNTGA